MEQPVARPTDLVLAPAPGVDTAVLDELTLAVALYDPRVDLVHRPNPAAGAVWLLCDGTGDEASVAAEIAEIFDLDPEAARADVSAALDSFWEAGVLAGSPAPQGAQPLELGTQVLPREPDP